MWARQTLILSLRVNPRILGLLGHEERSPLSRSHSQRVSSLEKPSETKGNPDGAHRAFPYAIVAHRDNPSCCSAAFTPPGFGSLLLPISGCCNRIPPIKVLCGFWVVGRQEARDGAAPKGTIEAKRTPLPALYSLCSRVCADLWGVQERWTLLRSRTG